jgi:hypothetical protein
VQNMKTGPDTHSTAENESGSAKYENRTRRTRYRLILVCERKTLTLKPVPSVPPEMSPGAKNIKTGHGALGTVEYESGSAKHEHWTRRTWYRCVTLFRALLTAVGQWDVEEGHGDPSRACIYLAPVELTAHTHWDAHSGGF